MNTSNLLSRGRTLSLVEYSPSSHMLSSVTRQQSRILTSVIDREFIAIDFTLRSVKPYIRARLISVNLIQQIGYVSY